MLEDLNGVSDLDQINQASRVKGSGELNRGFLGAADVKILKSLQWADRHGQSATGTEDAAFVERGSIEWSIVLESNGMSAVVRQGWRVGLYKVSAPGAQRWDVNNFWWKALGTQTPERQERCEPAWLSSVEVLVRVCT